MALRQVEPRYEGKRDAAAAASPQRPRLNEHAYDWGVLAETASELGLKGGDAFRSLQAMPRFCTCVNEQTKRNRTAYFFKRLNTWIA